MTNRIWISATVAGCLIGGTVHGQSSQTTFPEVNGLVEFMLPSTNIGCTFIPRATATYTPRGGGPELSCDRREPVYVNVDMGPSGPAKRTDNPGEQSCCGGPNVLQYGQTWTGGPFTCAASQSGLVCGQANGHGFSMSRASVEAH